MKGTKRYFNEGGLEKKYGNIEVRDSLGVEDALNIAINCTYGTNKGRRCDIVLTRKTLKKLCAEALKV